MSAPLRSGLGGYAGDESEHERRERAEVAWEDATLAVRDAANVFEEVLGDRRRAEADADRERERSRSRFI